ncbi:mdm2-binding protein [Myripristis murdjan]|uniref:MDM2 binding protein n=1 Tax=Myripristis murdjan TaxID=586833 RepID=A0A667YLT0_9TELE|nr:mdm2-binding protein [Myripristis murdjan]
MDRYVMVVSFSQANGHQQQVAEYLEPVKQIYNRLEYVSSQESVRGISVFPACSLSGSPSAQRWYFAVQACQGAAQFCSSDWEELGAGDQKTDNEEEKPNALDLCFSSLSDQEGNDQQADQQTLTELLAEAAEGLHLLSDKLPPPGKALLDVIVLGYAEQCPSLKDLLPLLGALKHLACWHTAKITVVTQHANGWQKAASYLSAGLVEPADLDSCIDHRELWRGGLLIREKKCVSELSFEGFCLRSCQRSGSSVLQIPCTTTDHKLQSEVFHYYRPVLDLVQLITLSDLPSFLLSSTQFELGLSGTSLKAKLLLDQLRSLRGKVGALFCLSCIITPVAQPPASQLSSQRWRESLARRPKSLPVPEVELKGESAHYFLLVQGSEACGSGACRVRMIHSANQINGAAAMATLTGLLREKSLSSSGRNVGNSLRPLPCFQGDSLLKRERRVTQVQTLVLKECLRRRVEASSQASIPVNDLKVLLSLAREQYLKMTESALPSAAPCLMEDPDNTASKTPEFKSVSSQQSEWPERSVLHNIENLQRRRQKKRFGLLSGPGSSDSLLGPKDSQKASSALDAKELLKHFTSDGMPTGELQPLAIHRGGNNVFQLSPDLSPRKVSQMPFSKATASRYHGIEFCLDNQQALDRDRGFSRLQSRLIRYETQTTCSREPCPLPFALSPAPSPAVMSEPGSVPDGETLQNADVARLKRRSWDTDITGGYPRKRLAKSESSDSLGSQSSSSSGTHPSVRSLRQQPIRSQSTSSCTSSSATGSRWTSSGVVNPCTADKPKPTQQKTPHNETVDKPTKESRSQKHHRMLREVVAKTLKQHGITAEHKHFDACSQRLFEISKFYLKDLKTSRGLHEEMKKAASSNAKQVIDWVLEKASKK